MREIAELFLFDFTFLMCSAYLYLRGVLKSLTTMVNLSISPKDSVSFCLKYFEATDRMIDGLRFRCK